MHYLYSDAVITDPIEIFGEEARHARVLRLHIGEKIGLLNGQGNILTTTVRELAKDRILLNYVDTQYIDPPQHRIHIALPLTKQIDRFEWFVEKATELGVLEITPLICEHSERSRINPGRLRNIILSALKQCGRPWLPFLHELTSFKDLLKQDNPGTIVIAHINGQPVKKMWSQAASVTICIGPEGDFSEAEMSLVKEYNLPLISLGSYRLRTETAAILAATQFMNADF